MHNVSSFLLSVAYGHVCYFAHKINSYCIIYATNTKLENVLTERSSNVNQAAPVEYWEGGGMLLEAVHSY